MLLSGPGHRSLDDAGSEALMTPKPCRGSHAAVMTVDPKFLPGSRRKQKRGRLFSLHTDKNLFTQTVLGCTAEKGNLTGLPLLTRYCES